MRRFRLEMITSFCLMVLLLLSACMEMPMIRDDRNEGRGGEDDVNDDEGNTSITEGELDISNATGEGIDSVISSINRFGLDVFLTLEQENEGANIFISPYSLYTALSMTYEGARGRTAEEMFEVMHLVENESLRRSSFASIQNGISGEGDHNLSTANSIWPQYNKPFKEDFINIIKRFYLGEVNKVDFYNEYEKARILINEWVENETNGKIKDLIPRGVIDPATVMVLTNAIYFRSEWARTFDENLTKDLDFHPEDGRIVSVPMMISRGEESIYNYTEKDGVQVLELPYSGVDLSMLVLLPKDGDLDSLINGLSWEMIQGMREDLEEMEVEVTFPKFRLSNKYFMRETLIDMGMKTAFDPSADFTGMLPEPIWIDQVIHQGFIEVDEEGTEAAAATAVVMKNYSMEPESEIFRADHPFLFIIQERDTGNILFLGKVSDPTSK